MGWKAGCPDASPRSQDRGSYRCSPPWHLLESRVVALQRLVSCEVRVTQNDPHLTKASAREVPHFAHALNRRLGKAREVSAWPVWMFLNRLLVFPYHLECRARHKDGDAAKIQILVRVHLDVVDLGEVQIVAGHVHPPQHLLPGAGQLHVLERVSATASSARLPDRGQ